MAHQIRITMLREHPKYPTAGPGGARPNEADVYTLDQQYETADEAYDDMFGSPLAANAFLRVNATTWVPRDRIAKVEIIEFVAPLSRDVDESLRAGLSAAAEAEREETARGDARFV